MQKNWENKVTVKGYLYDHTLSNRISKKTGTPFIMGDLLIATDDDAMNIVTVHFTYVTENFNSGKPNSTYKILQQIIDGAPSYSSNGKDAAMKLNVDGRIEVNDFYTRDNELVSPKRIGGAFVNVLNINHDFATDGGATFVADVVLSGCAERENDDDIVDVTLNGYAFNFRNDILPVSFDVRGKAGQDYFIGQDISPKSPMVTKISGDIVSTTEVTTQEEEGAFGGPAVKTTTRTFRCWDVTWAASEPKDWDDESTITKEELKECLAKREEYLAGVKKSHDEYIASQKGKEGFPTENKSSKPADDDDEDFVF